MTDHEPALAAQAIRDVNPAALRVHQQLVNFGDESYIRHDTLCGAHPALDDGPCGCAPGALAAVVRGVVAIHAPRPSGHVNSLECPTHNPNRTRRMFRLHDFEACPDCVVTPLTVCSCWACEGYPCETVAAVLAALRIPFADLEVRRG